MKKRAVISALASFALAGAMCVGFAACGGETAASIQGEEVDKATWDAAFGDESLDNFKVDFDMKNVADYGEYGYDGSEKISVKYVNGNQQITLEGSSKVNGKVPDEMKEHLKDSKIKLDYFIDGHEEKYIDEVDGKWAYVSPSSTAPYTEVGEIFEMIITSESYEDYEFSAEKKGYVLKGATAGQSSVVKFKDGKMKAVYFVSERTQGGATQTTTVSAVFEFGGQEVTLPTVA